MTRRYRLGKRAETAEETRQRIVQATYELHKAKGIAATTIRDIAERADVSPGTVYHHYPEYGDVIVACGRFTFGVMRPPTAAIFDGVDSPEEKLRALVAECFAAYQRFPAYEKIRAERDLFPELEAAFAQDEENRRALIREAVRPHRAGRRAVAIGFALLDISVYHRLAQSGLSYRSTVTEVSALLVSSLLGEERAG